MKIILAGYEGSKAILSASSYLLAKYLPFDFDIKFLNFGTFNGALYCGEYVSLAPVQEGGAERWGRYLVEYLNHLRDEFVIFGLDDYLMHDRMDFQTYAALAFRMRHDPEVISARLCTNSFYKQTERDIVHDVDRDFIYLRDMAPYSASTQYCIWRKDFLSGLLFKYQNPWRFEIEGSEHLNGTGKKVIGTETPACFYEDCSCLSEKWPGKVRAKKLKPEDIDYLVNMGHLKKEDLILCEKTKDSSSSGVQVF